MDCKVEGERFQIDIKVIGLSKRNSDCWLVKLILVQKGHNQVSELYLL